MSDDFTIDNHEREGQLSRSDLLKGGAGALAASGVLFYGSPALAGLKRRPLQQRPRRGGRLVWSLEQDPVHIAPFGGILTSNHWGKEFMYDSLLEWDARLNIRNALAASYRVVNPRTVDFTLKRGIRFHNGKEVTAADAKYSFDRQAAPPPPGSSAVLGQFPAIESTEARSRYVLRVNLRKPDATLFGYLAWSRYSAIVPEGMYDQVNPARQGIGTGPFRLTNYTPNDRVDYVRWDRFWKRGLPFLDSLQLKVLPDEQARIANLRAGAIDGATVSPDAARALARDRNLRVLRNLTAAFRELQFTIKTGERKPWHDRRVRQAVNHALNRQEMIERVYGGNGRYSGHVPPGFGPWPIPDRELRERYLKFDLPRARQLMRQAGFARGFEVTMTTFSTPLDFPQLASVIRSQLARINVEVNIEAQEPGTFARNNGIGNFDWDLTARGMRGDVNGYLAEFNPSSPAYRAWFPAYRNVRMWRLIGNGQITLEERRRRAIYSEAQRLLLTELLEVPLISVMKFQVVRRRVNNMYVAFSDFNTGLRTAWVSGR
jgi:peptide/nickel transport system substrate-binding protein